MWFRRKRSLEETGFFRGFTDYHCHILPGVDDGIRTLQEALSVLGEYERLGISQVWLTPHVMEDIPNSTALLQQVYGQLCQAYKASPVHRGDIVLHLAAEYMLDVTFDERLASGDLLTLGEDGRHLLVETSYFMAPANLLDTLRRIKSCGYFPVLAHPERYIYMEMDYYERLCALDVKFQLNLPSLAGLYNREAGRKAETLLQAGMYTLSGTDLHRPSSLSRLLSSPASRFSPLL